MEAERDKLMIEGSTLAEALDIMLKSLVENCGNNDLIMDTGRTTITCIRKWGEISGLLHLQAPAAELAGVVINVTDATIAVQARLNAEPGIAREIAEAVLRNAGVDVVEKIIEGSFGAADACVIDGKESFYIDLDPALDGKKVAVYLKRLEA